MSRSQRLTFLAIAAVVAVIAVVVLASGGGDEQDAARQASESTQQPVPSRGEGPASPQEQNPIATTTTEDRESVEVTPEETPTPKPEPRIPVLAASSSMRIEVDKGDAVRFAVRSQAAERVHVHGYDLFKDVPAGGRVEFSFKANLEGIFEIELEDSGTPLGELRVNP